MGGLAQDGHLHGHRRWSRYCGAYVVSEKKKGTIAKAFKTYLDSYNTFASAPPKKLMIDRGSELKELDSVMEQYSQKRPCVFRSLTGQPVNLIEGFNAQLQRMCQVYKEAGIVSDFEDILYLVVNAINNQARKDRMGFTPIGGNRSTTSSGTRCPPNEAPWR